MIPRVSTLASAALALFSLAAAPTATAAQVCRSEQSPNLLLNPGFEIGLASWQANAGFASSGPGVDGAQTGYFVMPGAQTIRTILQTASVVSGQTYTLSADLQTYLDASASVSFKSCIFGIVKVSAAGSATVVSMQRTITKTPTPWEPIAASWTADGDSVTFELAASCAGSTTSGLELRWDNAVLRSQAMVEVCEGETDPPAATSSEAQEAPPTTTSDAQEAPPATTTSSAEAQPTVVTVPAGVSPTTTLVAVTTSSAAVALPTTTAAPTTTLRACRPKTTTLQTQYQTVYRRRRYEAY